MNGFLSHLGANDLEQLRLVLDYDPLMFIDGVATRPSTMSDFARKVHLLANRVELEQEFCRLGSWTFGSTKSYEEIVRDTAEKVGALHNAHHSTEAIEIALMKKLLKDVLENMRPDERNKLEEQLRSISGRFEKSHKAELSSLAALTAAQLSGFGVYMLGSTLLGAVNGALGLGLGFGAFTGLSSIIATATGPIGWTLLGMFTAVRMGAPKYKKVVPAILIIASCRGRREALEEIMPVHEPMIGLTSPPFTSNSPITEVKSSALTPESPLTDQTSLATTKSRRPNKAKTPPVAQVSKMDRIAFNQTEANRELRLIAMEYYGSHFLDLTQDEQQAVRGELKDRESLAKKADQEILENKEKVPKTAGKSEHTDEKKARKKLKVLHATYNNLQFTEQAAGRMLLYENNELYLSFLSELRMLNDGFRDDKHHVPRTEPKLFQKDCGRSGKLYYRRMGDANKTLVALLGDKKSQEADLALLRRMSHS